MEERSQTSRLSDLGSPWQQLMATCASECLSTSGKWLLRLVQLRLVQLRLVQLLLVQLRQ